LPVDGEIAIISYEGVHVLTLAHPEKIVHFPELSEGGDVYDWKQQSLKFEGRNFSILGLHGGTPRLTTNTGDRLAFDKGDKFSVYDAKSTEVFSHTFTDMSGDWRVVTFTSDGTYILFGLPYELEIFERKI